MMHLVVWGSNVRIIFEGNHLLLLLPALVCAFDMTDEQDRSEMIHGLLFHVVHIHDNIRQKQSCGNSWRIKR